MPFLVLIAIYAVRIARRPVDVRLKRRHAGPLAVATLAVALFLAWDRRVEGKRSWHEHPLSVAGTQPDGSVRLTVRALGRDTRRLYAGLRAGLPATLSGPHGMFDHTLGGARQIWIAGGIGIAPFLGWVSQPGPDGLPRADLFYCTSTADNVPFLPELTAAAQRHPALRLHLVHSRDQGRLTVRKIQAAAGPLTPDTHVFLCGPTAMVENLSIDLRRHGVSRHRLHAEHFALR